MPGALLIRRAELPDGRIADVRMMKGLIVGVGDFEVIAGEHVLEAGGGLLLPGLHDHHAHVAATAAALASVRCGPPQIMDETELAAALSAPGRGWLRGIGYHDSVAGPIDRHWLDRVAPDRPVRVQHRSGRMWIFNTLGLETLLQGGRSPPDELERGAGGWTGRLFDADAWLRASLGGVPPSFAEVGTLLARFGVTGVTDMTPANGTVMAGHFAGERRRGALPQRVLLAGLPELGEGVLHPALMLGPLKIHLHEAHLPDYDAVVATMRAAHAGGRAVAVHCVTLVELVFTLAALREAGVHRGDRIEHASVASAAELDEIAKLGLAVVTQPNFIHERGDAYRAAIAPADWPDLYRLRSVIAAGIPLAGGTDTPFGEADPWAAMAAAVSRRTARGDMIGQHEALTPEQALHLFTADPQRLDQVRRIREGAQADLCLLDRPWAQARAALSAALVRATVIAGVVVHDVQA